MEYTVISGTEMNVSRIAQGTWAIGGWMWGGTDERESIRTIHAALDKGINLIDTAPVYGFGVSEEIVGKAIEERGHREKVFIATKVGLEWHNGSVSRNSSAGRIRKEVQDSLRRLRTDYIDIYQVHWPDSAIPIEETARTMQALFKEGLIRAIGVSNYSPEQMNQFMSVSELHTVQPPYNLFERQIDRDVLPYVREKNLSTFAYGPLCRGLLTGTMQPVTSVMPTNNTTLTWAFATGECGSEGWAGLTPTQVASNVQAFVSAGKKYIISTGGQAGVFTCGSDAGFDTFVQRYITANMIGVDFDIEGGQSADVINNLVARVKVAKGKYPNLRFSFTLQTLGGNSGGLNQLGNEVMSAIHSTGLTGYIIDLMAMDYGSTGPGNCVVVNGACEMGQSAIQAAELLHSGFGVPYNQIELTPDIGGNDTQGETFTLADAGTISAYALQKGLAGIHFWSFDRDNDCAPGSSSPTCNAYGQAGRLGFTTSFLSDLGL